MLKVGGVLGAIKTVDVGEIHDPVPTDAIVITDKLG